LRDLYADSIAAEFPGGVNCRAAAAKRVEHLVALPLGNHCSKPSTLGWIAVSFSGTKKSAGCPALFANSTNTKTE
jgi:hypothetical protein